LIDSIQDVLSFIARYVRFHNCAQQEEGHMADPARYPGASRWVKLFSIAAGAMAVLVVIVLHAGGGLRHNMPSASALDDRTAPEGGG
jgi:hypothetical protein